MSEAEAVILNPEGDRLPPKDSVVFVVDLNAYITKHHGVYDIQNPRGEKATIASLVGEHYKFKVAKTFIEYLQCAVVKSITMDHRGGPIVYGDDGQAYLNAYSRPTLKPERGNFDLVQRLLDFITLGDELGKEWLLNWAAAKAQNPLESPGTALILAGAQGTGKSTFAGTVMPLILGEQNCTVISQNSLEGAFTSHFASKLWINADEATSRENSYDVANRVKTFITDPYIDYHAKGRPVIRVPNRANFVFTTNASIPVRLDSDDRRYTAFVQNESPAEEYTDALKNAHRFKTPTPEFRRQIAAFYAYLLDWKVDTKMASTAHQSESKREIQALSRPSYEDFFEEIKARGLPALTADCDGMKCETAKEERTEIVVGTDRFVKTPVLKKHLYTLYKAYCETQGMKPASARTFWIAAKKNRRETVRLRGRNYLWLEWTEDVQADYSTPTPYLGTTPKAEA